jgi:Multidrug resistance efflux pump
VKNIAAKKKNFIIAGAGILVVALIVTMVTGLMRANPARAAQASTYTPANSKDIVAWGEVKYNVVYDISIDFPSIVKSLDVKEGDKVTLGQSLVTLDMSEYQSVLGKLSQQVSINQAGLKNITQDTVSLNADIAQLQNDITRKTGELDNETNPSLKTLESTLSFAKNEADRARKDYESYQQLYNSGAISQSDLNNYKTLLDQKEKAVTDTENSIAKLKSDLRTEIDQLNVSLKYKQAQLTQTSNSNSANTSKQNGSVSVSQIDLDSMKNKSAKNYINDNHIVSCVNNGVVKNIRVINESRLGVQNTPTAVMQLIDMDSLAISAEVSEEFIGKVTLGETVKIVPSFNKELSIEGTVTQIAGLAIEDDGKRIVKVEVKPNDPDGLLKPGYTADVIFPVK